ncbi:MAG TPA: class F sortase [Micromonosporaceae bacterium]
MLVACRSEPSSVGGEDAARLAEPGPSPSVTGSGPNPMPVRPGSLPTAATVVVPRQLRIASISVTARVTEVGIDPATNDFAVPPSVDVVGWYKFGPGLEATAGSVVIAGHVDSAEEGKGAFFRLRELNPGDLIEVAGSDGARRTFTVVAREEWAKTRIPLDRYFSRDGAPRLTLITCGGPFDARERSYRDNIVVTAVPA